MDTLYKYVSAERALTCLPEVGDGALRATQPAALNDPFECSVTRTFVEMDERSGNRELAAILTGIHPTSPVSEIDIMEARSKHGSLYLRELLSRQLSQRFGIVSFASDPRHPLLWSHYTVDGSGFAVGYDVKQLSMLVDQECLRPVAYFEAPVLLGGYPVVSDEQNIRILLSYKSDHWNYEGEWRLIVELDQTIGTGNADQHGQPINLLRVPNPAVTSVYYTERTPSAAVQQVRRRLENINNRYGTTRPTKLVLSETKYGYEDAKS